jgi:uncharacterized heparinase superfamily protein
MTRSRLRLAGLMMTVGARRVSHALRLPLRMAAMRRGSGPERLLIAPQDIRTSDPTIAADIYAGYFSFAGKSVSAHGRSPFEIDAGSELWLRELAGFGWLRHLRAADTPLAGANARALVADFITVAGKPNGTAAWDVGVTARRLLSWLSQSPLILEGGDRPFYQRFMRAIGRTQGFLEAAFQGRLDGETRLLAAVALATLGISAQASGQLQRRSTKRLADEIDAQILPDGGSVSRNPQNLVDLLLDLLPLRQAYAARGIAPPPQVLNAIDRMIPMVRLFRHTDGSLALFNGMGGTQPSQLATILAYDDTRAAAVLNAPFSGYQRMEAESGGTVLIVDAGRSPPPALSSAAHAGCLSFELSAGGQMLVVNCGQPAPGRVAARAAARVTAAHSTLIVEDTSSCRFADQVGLARWLGDQIISGPTQVDVAREATSGATRLTLSHDGYRERFALVHERVLRLSDDGRRLVGIDGLRRTGRGTETYKYALRFHLHPNVRASLQPDNQSVLIDARTMHWRFAVPGVTIAMEDSIYFAGPHGPRSTEQIVISLDSARAMKLEWSFERVDG